MDDYRCGVHPEDIVDAHKARLRSRGYDVRKECSTLSMTYEAFGRGLLGEVGDDLARASGVNVDSKTLRIADLFMWNRPDEPSAAYRSLARRHLRVALEETIHIMELEVGSGPLIDMAPAYGDYLRETGAPVDSETLVSAILDELGLPFSRAEVKSRGRLYEDRIAYRAWLSTSSHIERLAGRAKAARPPLDSLAAPTSPNYSLGGPLASSEVVATADLSPAAQATQPKVGRPGSRILNVVDVVGTGAVIANTYHDSGARGVAGLGAVAAGVGVTQYGLSKAGDHLARTAGKSIAKKAAGKVAARFIPGVGYAMTAWDAGWNWNAYLSGDATSMEKRVGEDPMVWLFYKGFMWGHADPLDP